MSDSGSVTAPTFVPPGAGTKKSGGGDPAEPDQGLILAKRLVVDNYNTHRLADENPPITIDDVFVLSFTKVMYNWKAIVTSTVVRGLVWMITFNGSRSEAYIEIYKKVNNVKVPRGALP
jgi:Family of unknown function (DUF6275)